MTAPLKKTPPKPPVKKPDPVYSPEDAQRIESLAALRMNHDDIATVMDMTKTAMRKLYKDRLRKGSALAKVNILKSVHEQAVGAPAVFDANGRVLKAEKKPVPIMGIFLAKAVCGLRETDRVEHTGKGGGPIKHEAKIGIVIQPEDTAV